MRPVRIIAADENLGTENILEMVNTGTIETTVADSHIASIWAELLMQIDVHESVTVRTDSEIAWIVRKNNPILKENLNHFLKKHKKGTLLENICFKRYFKHNRWLKSPVDSADPTQLKKHKKVIKKYSSLYDYDWKIIIAMAFQESEPDHTKKSPAGAVGLMQVLPATAEDKRINIIDVHKLENNIHAGVKYLALLQNQHFKNKYYNLSLLSKNGF